MPCILGPLHNAFLLMVMKSTNHLRRAYSIDWNNKGEVGLQKVRAQQNIGTC